MDNLGTYAQSNGSCLCKPCRWENLRYRWYKECRELSTSNLNQVYDPGSDSWTQKRSLPTGISAYASAVANGKIYIIGGFSGTDYIDSNQIYDPKMDLWTDGAPIPNNSIGATAASTNGIQAPVKIYVIGGYSDFRPLFYNQIYDPQTNTWGSGSTLPTARSAAGVTVLEDKLYVIGSVKYYLDPPIMTNEQYTPPDYGAVSPQLYIFSPKNGITYLQNRFFLNFTINRSLPELTKLSYSLDGNAPVSITDNTTITDLQDGTHSITIYAQPQFSNFNVFAEIMFTIEASTQTPAQNQPTSTPTQTITQHPSQTAQQTQTPIQQTTIPSIPTMTPNKNSSSNDPIYWVIAAAVLVAVIVATVLILTRKSNKGERFS
jgi:hypothetical protein